MGKKKKNNKKKNRFAFLKNVKKWRSLTTAQTQEVQLTTDLFYMTNLKTNCSALKLSTSRLTGNYSPPKYVHRRL